MPLKSLKEEIAKFDALGFPWYESHGRSERAWERFISELIEFKKLHGHCNGGSRTTWLAQRINRVRQYRKKGKLTEQQIGQLDAMGFCWDRRPPSAAGQDISASRKLAFCETGSPSSGHSISNFHEEFGTSINTRPYRHAAPE